MTILTSCCRCGKPSRRCCWRTSWGRARTRLGSSSRSWRRSSRSCSWPSSAAPCRSSTSPTPPSPPTPRTAARYVDQRCHNIGHLKHYRLSLGLASKQQSLHEHYIWSTDDDLCCCLHILQQHDQPWSNDTPRKMIISIWSKFDLRSHIPIKSITRAALTRLCCYLQSSAVAESFTAWEDSYRGANPVIHQKFISDQSRTNSWLKLLTSQGICGGFCN